MKATLTHDYNEHLKKGDTVEGDLAKRLVRARLAEEGVRKRAAAPKPARKRKPKAKRPAKAAKVAAVPAGLAQLAPTASPAPAPAGQPEGLS